jgi:SAM-dependent methyltransferase
MGSFITEEQIQNMSYTEFISFVNQWNIPPGSLSTVSEWAVFSNLNSESNVLEIACTTGFSSREISRLTKCKAFGIDICNNSVETAIYNHQMYCPDLNLRYQCIDAHEFNTQEQFTHIILGAALGFFENPKKILTKCINFFDNEGYILASPYYGIDQIPEKLNLECKRVIGITPTSSPYEQIRDLYQDFEILYESRKNIVIETVPQMKKYAQDIAENACKIRKIENLNIFDILYNRIYEIKFVCNELHKYQSYSVMVLRYIKNIYPNRFIELF